METTPVMRQYQAAKAAHPGALLFFRMGDFYELFYDDAVVAARALNLTLTSRNKGAADEVPMAGVPHHAATAYIQKLLDQGHSVALCEQMADPSKVKGIVPREVVRVVTPGLTYDDEAVTPREHHTLAVVLATGGTFGLAAMDASTGDAWVVETTQLDGALAELSRWDPREVLTVTGDDDALPLVEAFRATRATVAHRFVEPIADDAAVEALDESVGDVDRRRLDAWPRAKSALGIVCATVKACDPHKPLAVSRISASGLDDTLALDETTQAHLEIVRSLRGDKEGTLLRHLDCTVTAGGARLLRERLLAPLRDVRSIQRRLDAVEHFVVHASLRAAVRKELDAIADLARVSTRISLGRGTPKDLGALQRSLARLPALVALLGQGKLLARSKPLSRSTPVQPGDGTAEEDALPCIHDDCSDLRDALAHALVDDPPLRLGDGETFRQGFDTALDEASSLARDGQRYLVELEARLREETQIPSLKLRYTRVFGWYLEVTKTHVSKAPEHWRRKQTVAGGERFTCDELDALADKVAHAQEQKQAREAELYGELTSRVGAAANRLRALGHTLAEVDVAAALAEVAHRYDYCRPSIDTSRALEIRDGRHPVVERLAAEGRFVPNDIVLGEAEDGSAATLWLVTGPNMAGKSTIMRQAALIVLLAQAGSFVPAASARIGLVDRILTRVGASDNVARGESTFMVEMKETAHVLRHATARSLVVLDEIGRGTSTYDGLSIAWAVAEYLHDTVGCRALFATHYHELTKLSDTRPTLANVSVSAREHDGHIVFLHKLEYGAASRSYGVACAKLAGVPEPVLERAGALLRELERQRDDNAQMPNVDGAGTSRTRKAAPSPQLSLFGGSPLPEGHLRALETLREVDPNTLTPLDALTLLARLRSLVHPA